MKTLRFLLLFIATAAFAQDEVYPLPNKVIKADGMSIDSYDFAAFEKFLDLDTHKTYVINFWATWCQPCVKELPYFEQLGEAYRKSGVEVILVSLDMSKQVESRLLPFIKRKGLKSKTIYLQNADSGDWIAKVDPSWSGALPATVIYNKSHRKFFERGFTYEELEAELKPFIP